MGQRKDDWKTEILPSINAALILILFLHFYEGDVDTIMYVVAIFFAFGGKIRNRVINFFMKKITQAAHLLLCIGLVSIGAYIFVPKVSKSITERIKT